MRLRYAFLAGTLALTLLPLIPRAEARKNLETVPAVEVPRYLGTWYEVMRIPNKFETGCRKVTATYSMNSNGTLQVVNRCLRDGVWEDIVGRAWIRDASNAKLKVTFARFLGRWWRVFGGAYWILDLGPLDEQGRYTWAVVGEPDRNYGWILAREPHLDHATLDHIFARLTEQGYHPARFVATDHDEWLQQMESLRNP